MTYNTRTMSRAAVRPPSIPLEVAGMAVENTSNIPWERLTFARVRLLRELEDRRTLHEVAELLGISYNGVRSCVNELKVITGCSDVRELGRWWRQFRGPWLAWCERQAGQLNRTGYGTDHV